MKVPPILRKVGWILPVALFWLCDTPSMPEADPSPQISNVSFEYDQDHILVWAQVETTDPQGLDNIDSVWIVLTPLSGAGPANHFSLNDDGTDGDLLNGNGVFTGEIPVTGGIPFALYRMIAYAVDLDGHQTEKPGVVNIEEEFPPIFQAIDLPGVFHLDPTEWGTLTIQVKIDDQNGSGDISYVRYAINKDYLPVDCEGNYNPDPNPDHYQWDPSWFMVYQYTDEDGYLIYETGIPMRPVDDGTGGCGKTGLALFQFSVKDHSNQMDISSENTLEIIQCGDGFCQAAFEDGSTCPEDCP